MSAELRLFAGQDAECPHCGGAITKETPVLAADDPQSSFDPADLALEAPTVVRLSDRRPKCPHCYGRFILIVEGFGIELRHPADYQQ